MHIFEIEFASSQSVLASLNFGSLKIYNSTFEHISSPLFQLNSMSVSFEKVTIKEITCETIVSCIIDSKFSDLKILSSEISEIRTNNELMTFTSCDNIRILDTQFFNVKKIFEKNDHREKMYAIQANRVTNITIEKSIFQNIELPFVMVKASNVTIFRTIFTNFKQKPQVLPSKYQDQEIRFVTLDESNSLMINNSFLGDLTNNTGNGGVTLESIPIIHFYLGNSNYGNRRES